ncbi:MAG: radical SAM protein [Thermoplasmata archaeon]
MIFYFPGRRFPSLSVTGERCSLRCPHCKGEYLKGMENVDTPEKLYDLAIKLDDKGHLGFLLSGGCDEAGEVPLEGYYDIIKKIKKETSLKINIHTGLPDDKMVEELSRTNIDVVSYDVIGSREVIKNVYGLDRTPEDYYEGYNKLTDSGFHTVPHITVGLGGKGVQGEMEGVDHVRDAEKIILNSLIPSDYGRSVRTDDFLLVLDHALEVSEADIVLGCMREKGRANLEIQSIKRGVSGIVNPSLKTRRWAESRYDIVRKDVCCAL